MYHLISPVPVSTGSLAYHQVQNTSLFFHHIQRGTGVGMDLLILQLQRH